MQAQIKVTAMHHNLFEGLKANSLEHLVLPLISVDEFESKIDDRRCVVVGFYVMDKDPAEDLSSFIDMSNRDVLDTEVGPAPTPDGYYMVFAELRRNAKFSEKLIEILKLIKNLCNINVDAWQMKCIGHEKLIPVSIESIQENIILDENEIPEIEEKTVKKEEVKEHSEFWKFATVDAVKLNESTITLFKNQQQYEYEIIDEAIDGPVNLNETTNANILQSLVGPSYNVWSLDKYIAVELGDQIKILKTID